MKDIEELSASEFKSRQPALVAELETILPSSFLFGLIKHAALVVCAHAHVRTNKRVVVGEPWPAGTSCPGLFKCISLSKFLNQREAACYPCEQSKVQFSCMYPSLRCLVFVLH